jgi:hypothetical protein
VNVLASPLVDVAGLVSHTLQGSANVLEV